MVDKTKFSLDNQSISIKDLSTSLPDRNVNNSGHESSL